ncbi:hypothetical protein MK280_19885 [Myxococcota bacterium]|nr:hypothetical protein [Myxococcota bacterium]
MAETGLLWRSLLSSSVMRPYLLACLIFALLPACATRTASTTVINQQGLEIRLRSEKPTLGFKTIPRGFNQPIQISPARLQAILSGIQVDERPSRKSTIRERRFAISRKLLPKIADGLAKAYAEAGPNQEIVVLALEKRMHNFVFTRKFLTSFVTWVEGDEMVVDLSRLGWEANERRAKDKMEPARYDLPTPIVGEIVMPFNTVDDGPYHANGPQGVKVSWRDSDFGAESIEKNVAGHRTSAEPPAEAPEAEAEEATSKQNDLAGAEAAPSAATVAGASTVTPAAAVTSDATAASALGPSTVQSSETLSAGETAGSVSAVAATPASTATSEVKSKQGDALRGLSAQDLRELADLEEARSLGQITIEQYEARRNELLQKAN